MGKIPNIKTGRVVYDGYTSNAPFILDQQAVINWVLRHYGQHNNYQIQVVGDKMGHDFYKMPKPTQAAILLDGLADILNSLEAIRYLVKDGKMHLLN